MTDFDARWRAAANADPGHATYPEAVPGYRPESHARGRTGLGERDSIREPSSEPLRAAEPVTRTDHDTGGMIVHWPPLDGRPAEPKPDGDPVTVAEIRQRAEPFDSEAELRKALGALTAAKVTTEVVVQTLTDATREAAREPGKRVDMPGGCDTCDQAIPTTPRRPQ